jgi:hypothetical protein
MLYAISTKDMPEGKLSSWSKLITVDDDEQRTPFISSAFLWFYVTIISPQLSKKVDYVEKPD